MGVTSWYFVAGRADGHLEKITVPRRPGATVFSPFFGSIAESWRGHRRPGLTGRPRSNVLKKTRRLAADIPG
jgi:hypothetical protein